MTSIRRGQPIDIAMIVVGLAVLGAGMLVVRNGRVPEPEVSVFRAVNDLPGGLYPVVWPFQQLGALVLGPVVALVAVARRRYRLAVGAVAVTVLKLAGERLVKAVVTRERPGTSIGADVELRGDVHVTGESFVSGHAVLVAGLAGVVAPYLGGRWRAVPWVLVAAVMVGRVYVGAHNPLDVICGAGLGVAIAGLVNLVLGVRRRTVTRRRDRRRRQAGRTSWTGAVSRRHRGVAVAGVLGTCVAMGGTAACDGSSRAPVATDIRDDGTITVGSFDFTESVILAEVYSQGLEAAGFRVQRAFWLGPREFVGPALAAGLIELVPEYAGAAAEFHSLGGADPSRDVEATHRELVRALDGRGITALAAAPGQDANTFVVTRATAERFGLSDLSDLSPVAAQLTFGGPPECPARPTCLVGLAEAYGAHFDDFVSLDAAGALTHEALINGTIDIALLFTTDPAIEDLDLVELTDDRGLQPAENITPLLRSELVEGGDGDEVVATIDAISAHLTTEVVRDLDRAVVEDDGGGIPAIVATWWAEVSS